MRFRKKILVLVICCGLNPTIAEASTKDDATCIQSLQYVESRLQEISTHLAQSSNIIHSESFLNKWMTENKFSNKSDVATYLFDTHLSNAKKLIYENQFYMETKYKVDCYGAPYYETGLKVYGNSFNQDTSNPENWWVRYSEVVAKVTLLQSAANNLPTPETSAQSDNISNGNTVAIKIKEVYRDLQSEAVKRFGSCIYNPSKNPPLTPNLTKWSLIETDKYILQLNEWFTDELKNLNQSGCAVDQKVGEKVLSKEQIYEQELVIVKKYYSLLDDFVSEKLGPQIVGQQKWTSQPPSFLSGDFSATNHLTDFESKTRAWFELESRNISINNTRISASDWVKVITATSSYYAAKFADLVSLNFGAGQYSFKNLPPTPKNMNYSAESYLTFHQTIKKWFNTESDLDKRNFRAEGAQTSDSKNSGEAPAIIEEEEEKPTATFTGKVNSTGTTIRVSTNLSEENLILRASKKGSKTLIFRITVSEDGLADFKTKRSLKSFNIQIFFEGAVIHSGRL